MAERPFAYVCSPFRGDAERNAERAREYSRKIFEAGYCPITPHIYFPQFLSDDNPKEREAGIDMGIALLPQCCALVVCGDKLTIGMKLEIAAANRLGIPIYSKDIFLQAAACQETPASHIAKHFRADSEKTGANSVLKQIAASRKKGAAAGKSKNGRPRKSRGEEL